MKTIQILLNANDSKTSPIKKTDDEQAYEKIPSLAIKKMQI